MRILLTVDDALFAEQAIRTLIAQVKTRGAEIRVLHVIEDVRAYISAEMIPHLVAQVAAVEEERRKQAEALVRGVAQKLRKAGFRSSEAIEQGDPKTAIIDAANKWRADLIVVGTHGWKGLNRFLLGSVSEAVVRHAGCSVQVIRHQGAAKRSNDRKRRK